MSEIANALTGAGTPPIEPGAPPQAAPPVGTPPEGAPPAPPAAPDWMASLPDDLRSDADLVRYPSVEALAKGLKETRSWARGRIPIPQSNDESAWKELGEKLRPETIEGYEIPVPEGDGGETAAAFKDFAFDHGIPAHTAKAVAEFHNRAMEESLSKMATANKAELQGLELDFGAVGYNARLDAVNNMLASAGIEGFEAVDALANAPGVGVGKAMRALFTLAEKTGELAKVDGASVEMRMGTLTASQAQAEINRMFDDKDTADKLKDRSSPAYAKYQNLLARAAQGDG